MADPVIFYDVSLDANREVTQADVDRLVRIANAYGELRRSIDRVSQIAHNISTGEPALMYGRGKP